MNHFLLRCKKKLSIRRHDLHCIHGCCTENTGAHSNHIWDIDFQLQQFKIFVLNLQPCKVKKVNIAPSTFWEHFLFSHFYYCKRAEVFILNSWVCISHNKILLIAESTPLHHRVSSCLRKATGFIHPLLSPGLFALYWGEKPLHNWLLCALCLRHLPIAAVGSIPPAELGPWGFWPKHKGHLFSFPSPWPMTQDEP